LRLNIKALWKKIQCDLELVWSDLVLLRMAIEKDDPKEELGLRCRDLIKTMSVHMGLDKNK